MTKRALGYGDGIGTGIAVLAIAAACWLAKISLQLGPMYKEMSPAVLSATTRFVLSPVWIYGVPIVLVGALVTLHVKRPRGGLATLAVVAIAVDIFWYLAAYGPIFSLAGNIK